MGIFADVCPLCGVGPNTGRRDIEDLLNKYVDEESYAGKWISIDIPADLYVHEAVQMKEWLYRKCKGYNKNTKGKVKFNLDSLR